jgi:protoporphyrin/coproporphyrin ferrochelatase
VSTFFDSMLFVAFGGPTPGCCRRWEPCPGSEAVCFVRGIVGPQPAAQARIAEVATHYAQLGGFSPFNDLTFQQVHGVRHLLQQRGLQQPVYVGMRHWRPYLHDVLRDMVQHNLRRILAVIMAPHQCYASWQWYQQTVRDGLAALGVPDVQVTYLQPWVTQPGYVEAIADHVRQACAILGPQRAARAALVYTAHSIPTSMAEDSPYVSQFTATAEAVTQRLGRSGYHLAYQSQVTGTPRPWLQPDINDAVRQLAAVSHIGFLCDHVEVLYDLDVEARQTAAACGIALVRAQTVGSHPAFLGMLSDLIAARLGQEEGV